jgi:DNA-binding transcriptional regulator YdaS (Cro superfamily)
MAYSDGRDDGLQTALTRVGGVSALARLLSISQPTVSNWKRVPIARVFQIEAITGLSRRVLRPDLFDVPEPKSVKSINSTSLLDHQ